MSVLKPGCAGWRAVLMEQALLRSRRRRQPFAALCLASPIVLGLGWSALWLFAQRQAGIAMDAWMATEAGHGRQWTCGDRTITGYPLQLRISCAEPSFHGKVGGETLDISAARLEALAAIYQPNAIEASVTSPVKIAKAGQDNRPTLTWTALKVQGRLLIDGSARVALVAEDAALEDAGTTSKAAHVELRFSPAPGSGNTPQDRAYAVWFKLDDASVPAVDAVAGETAPISLDERGVLTAVEPPTADPWPIQIEAWRQAGGVFDLTSLAIRKGEFRAEAQGRLGLDDVHRVAGRLQTALWGYEPLAARFGVPARALSMGNALSKLLNGNASKTASDQRALRIPISLSDGRVAVGPVGTSVRLVPLY